MATLYTQIDSNRRKTIVLFTVFFVFVIGVSYVFSVAMDDPGILFIAVIISIAMSFVSYFWSDKIVLAMSSAKEVSMESNKEIYRLVENLCITAGLPLPKIYVIEDRALNAFATGRNPKNAVVCLTTGIIERLDRSELEGVIAHELSHIGNRDILIATIAVVLVGVVALLADWFRRWSFFGGFRKRDRDDRGQLGAIIAIAAIVLAILAPLFAKLVQLAISRKREYLADASGVLLTRHPEALASALEKILNDTERLSVANRATAPLYISNPFSKKNISNLFSTHPPIEERIQRLRER